MRRRTFDDIRVETIVAERAGVLRHARVFAGQVDGMVALGRLEGVDADALKDRIHAFAEGIASGLHLDGRDPAGVRAMLRALRMEAE